MYQHDRANSGSVDTAGPRAEVEATWTFESDGEFRAQPAVRDGRIYVTSTDSNLYAVSQSSGEEEWSVGTSGPLSVTPSVANGIVFTPTSRGRVFAHSAGSGSGQWVYTSERSQFRTPTTVGRTVLAGDGSGNVHALSSSTGTRTWLFESAQSRIEAHAPTVDDQNIYSTGVLSSDEQLFDEPGVASLSIDGGTKQWEHVEPSFYTASSTTVFDDSVCTTFRNNSDDKNKIVSLSTAGGSVNWAQENVGRIDHPLAYDGNSLYATSNSNAVHAIDPAVGTIKWTVEVGGTPTAPVVSAETVYVGAGDNLVYAFDKRNGEQLWTFSTGNSIVAAPVVLDETVYVASTDGSLYALKEQSEIGPGDVTGDGQAATDPDGDGYYEDVNGDGSFTILDVQALYANLETGFTGRRVLLASPRPSSCDSGRHHDGNQCFCGGRSGRVPGLGWDCSVSRRAQ
jgi:outer membrane protein assembly factor BamB